MRTDRLSDNIDFPSPIQVIAVSNCQNELRIAQEEWGTSLKMHFERFLSEEVLKSHLNILWIFFRKLSNDVIYLS